MSDKTVLLDFDAIIYHSPCPDGEASLWCALHHINYTRIIVPCEAGKIHELSFDQFKDKKIVFVDLCPSYDVLQQLKNIAKNILILDHHQTALKMFGEKYNNNFIIDYVNQIIISNDTSQCDIKFILDKNRSGCQITWDYFNSPIDNFKDLFEYQYSQKRPWFINYIADRDLWLFKLPNSKEINTGLFHKQLLTYNKMFELENYSESDINNIIEIGKIIIEIQTIELNNLCDTAIETIFTQNNIDYHVWLVNGNTIHYSELGNMLTKKTLTSNPLKLPDFVALWNYDFKKDEWKISLRGDDKHDLSTIAKNYNEKGGGHVNAAGFVLHKYNLIDNPFDYNIPIESIVKSCRNNDTLHDLFKIV